MSMFPIASGSLTGSGLNIGSIPQTFAHLQLRLFARSTAAAATAIGSLQFNSDVLGNNYNSHFLQSDGTSVTAGAQGTNTYITWPVIPAASSTSNVYGYLIVDIFDYTSTTKNKTIRVSGSYDANGSGVAVYKSGIWFKTPEAISTINLGITTGWAANSRFDLYGISTSNATGA
jgi:hypothetical protein